MTSKSHKFYNSENILSSDKALVVLKSLSQIFGMLSLLFLARVLSVEQYGIYNVILSALTLLGGIASFGIANVLQRYLPEYIRNNNYSLAKRLFVKCCSLRFLSIVACTVAIYIYRDSVFHYIQISYDNSLLILLFVYAVSYFQMRLTNLALYSFLKVKLANLSQIFVVFIKVLGYAIAFFLDWALIEILVIDVVAHIVCLSLVFWFWRKQISPLQGGRSELGSDERKRLIKYGLFFNFSDVGGSFLGKDLSNLILLKYLDPTIVAVNALSYRIADILLKFSPTRYFSDIIRPLMFSLNPIDEQKTVSRIFSILTKITLIVEIPILVLIFFSSNVVLGIVGGDEYSSYGGVLTCVLAILGIGSLGLPIGLVAQLHERTDIIFYSKFIAILNVALAILLVEKYGIYGVLIATAVSSSLKNLFIWFFIREYASYRSTLIFLLKFVPIWGAFGLLYYFYFSLIDEQLISFVLLICSIVLFFILSLRLNLFDKQESEFIVEYLPRRVIDKMTKLKVIKC